MIKTITLNYAYGSLEDREPFLCDLENDDLVLEFNSPYKLDKAVLVLSNNKTTRRYKLENPFRVPKELLLPGELLVTVSLTMQGNRYHDFAVEPILIKESGAQIVLMPEIEPMKARIAELEQRVEKLEISSQSFKEAVTAQLQATVAAHNKLVEQVKILQDEQAL